MALVDKSSLLTMDSTHKLIQMRNGEGLAAHRSSFQHFGICVEINETI